ncbi:hypothetical protein HDU76_013248 [Blyttiomyces sp. JEL0837]|nr:hypothetical protein HDU76_013248 [Blyttiomyces sp. JEL0837]
MKYLTKLSSGIHIEWATEAFEVAIRAESIEGVNLLIETGAWEQVKANDRTHLFIEACRCSDYLIVCALFDNGVPDIWTHKSCAAFQAAAANVRISTAKILLELANENGKISCLPQDALILATRLPHSLFRTFLKKGNFTSIDVAECFKEGASFDRTETMEFLLEGSSALSSYSKINTAIDFLESAKLAAHGFHLEAFKIIKNHRDIVVTERQEMIEDMILEEIPIEKSLTFLSTLLRNMSPVLKSVSLFKFCLPRLTNIELLTLCTNEFEDLTAKPSSWVIKL